MHKNVSWPSLLLGVVGCRIDRATKPAPSDLAFTIAVSRATLRAGEPDTIVVSAANLTADSMVITFPHGCQVLPYIRDGQGRAVLPPGGNWLCTTVISQLRLGPRQVKEYRFVWTGSTAFASEMPLVALAPGTYYISATLATPELPLEAGPVAVQLLP